MNHIDQQVVVGNDVGGWGTLRNSQTDSNFVAESIYKERQTATGNKEGEEESGVKTQGTLASLTHRKRSMYCSKQQGQDPLPHIHAAAGTRDW